jgi:ribosomal protein S24E
MIKEWIRKWLGIEKEEITIKEICKKYGISPVQFF